MVSRKALAFRLSMLAFVFGVCSWSAFGSPTFSVTPGPVGDVVIDGTKAIVAQTAPGVMPIPEPTTLVLFGTGVATLLAKKIRRRFHK